MLVCGNYDFYVGDLFEVLGMELVDEFWWVGLLVFCYYLQMVDGVFVIVGYVYLVYCLFLVGDSLWLFCFVVDECWVMFLVFGVFMGGYCVDVLLGQCIYLVVEDCVLLLLG